MASANVVITGKVCATAILLPMTFSTERPAFGAAAESRFVRGIGTLDVEGPSGADFERMAELIDQYAHFPLGGTDASVVALAERLDAPIT